MIWWVLVSIRSFKFFQRDEIVSGERIHAGAMQCCKVFRCVFLPLHVRNSMQHLLLVINQTAVLCVAVTLVSLKGMELIMYGAIHMVKKVRLFLCGKTPTRVSLMKVPPHFGSMMTASCQTLSLSLCFCVAILPWVFGTETSHNTQCFASNSVQIFGPKQISLSRTLLLLLQN